jgi:hypothetical protein
VDECGFNLHLRRNYGRNVSGSRVSLVVPTIRGRNVTLLSAINGNGIFYFKIFEGCCTGSIFSTFLQELDRILNNVFPLMIVAYLWICKSTSLLDCARNNCFSPKHYKVYVSVFIHAKPD